MVKIIQNADLTETTLNQLTIDETEWVYNALDVCLTLEIGLKQAEEMDEIAANTSAFSHSLMAPTFEMSLRGTRINTDARRKTLANFSKIRDKLATNLKLIVEEGIGFAPFNYRSPVQLAKLFYTVFNIVPIKARKQNGSYGPTTNREALEKLQNYFVASPICRYILAIRDLDKKIQFLSTKLDKDNRMRTNYSVAGTKTGRLSSSESNFETGTNNQNIESALREVFIPDPGMKFCNVDLEQADSRNLGATCWNLFHDSHGPEFAGAYLDACESGDLHTQVCRMAWTEEPWPEDPDLWRAVADRIVYRDLSYRDMSKKLGHGTNYLGTPRTMAGHTKVDIKVIEDFQAKYFRAYPCIPAWHKHVIGLLQHGEVTSDLYNRRRYFFGLPDDPRTHREAIAFGPQSMTADAIDEGILNLWRNLKSIHLLIQVHDSILFQYPEKLEHLIVPKALELLTINHTLVGGRPFTVPLEAKIGWNWADRKEDKETKEITNEFGLSAWRGPHSDLRKTPGCIKRSRPQTLQEKLGSYGAQADFYN